MASWSGLVNKKPKTLQWWIYTRNDASCVVQAILWQRLLREMGSRVVSPGHRRMWSECEPRLWMSARSMRRTLRGVSLMTCSHRRRTNQGSDKWFAECIINIEDRFKSTHCFVRIIIRTQSGGVLYNLFLILGHIKGWSAKALGQWPMKVECL